MVEVFIHFDTPVVVCGWGDVGGDRFPSLVVLHLIIPQTLRCVRSFVKTVEEKKRGIGGDAWVWEKDCGV